MATVNELITALGFELKPDAMKKVQAIDKALGGIVSLAKKISLAVVGTKGVFDWMTGTVAKDAQNWIDLSEATNMSVESLQRWKYVAEASGKSSSALLNDIKRLRGTGFLWSDEDFFKNADRISKMTWREAQQTASRLGISEDTLRIFRKGPNEIRKLMSEAIVIPYDKMKQGAELNASLGRLKNYITELKEEIGTGLAPILQKQVDTISDWIEKNHELIEQKIDILIQGITKGFEQYVEIMKPAVEFASKFAKELFGITDKKTEIEGISKIVTGALLIITASKVVNGLASIAKSLNSMWTAAKGLGKIAIPALYMAAGGEAVWKGGKALFSGEDIELDDLFFYRLADKMTDDVAKDIGDWYIENMTERILEKGVKRSLETKTDSHNQTYITINGYELGKALAETQLYMQSHPGAFGDVNQ